MPWGILAKVEAVMLLSVVDARLDAADVEESLIRLRQELLDHASVVDVRAVSPIPSPVGSKAADGLMAALSVTVLHPSVLPIVMDVVRVWAVRRDRTVRVEVDGDFLELTGVTSAQQQEVLDAWLSRHSGDAR
jgi:hypothetical protein